MILPQHTSCVYLKESAWQNVRHFVIQLAFISCQTISVECLLFCWQRKWKSRDECFLFSDRVNSFYAKYHDEFWGRLCASRMYENNGSIKIRVYLSVKNLWVFLCFVAIVKGEVYYFYSFVFFVLRHWWVSQVFTPMSRKFWQLWNRVLFQTKITYNHFIV